uniref:bifunctional lytic transglycosylase/C40 family peptidase n=1 Tax=Carnobacterium sp. TaxID=48221 RepID=UPI00344C1FA6
MVNNETTNENEKQNTSIGSIAESVKKTKRLKKAIKFITNYSTLLLSGFLLLVIMVTLLAVSSSNSSNSSIGKVDGIGLSPTTLQWSEDVKIEAERQGVPELIPYILAIIEVESKGNGSDVMQSSESAGLPANGYTNAQDSIRQGIKYLKTAFDLAKANGLEDPLATVQSYNFGTAYVSYLINNGKQHSIEVAENYSRTVVAPSLGNSTGRTYSYVNVVSTASGKTYLYTNGGNFHYASLVAQYLYAGGSDTPIGNGTFQDVLNIALKFQGNPYVWGGDSPQVGFDCSGLLQWSYGQVGINLPRVAIDQWKATVPVSREEAQAGDLIFFKGTYGAPDYISHVGIYIDETRMYDSNGSGIGYHYHSGPYWSEHFDSIRRIVK